MNKNIKIIVSIGLIVLIVVIGGFILYGNKSDKSTEQPIRNLNISAGDLVESPLKITGEMRGPWFFEASFPVKLVDANGNLIVQHYAQAQSEWMTTDFVPFESELEFSYPRTETGFLVLEKDNPSGLPENAEAIEIPVRFKIQTRKVNLYYYNQLHDRDASGNVLCSQEAVLPVEREIPLTLTPAQDVVELLLKGELTAEEKAAGFSTEFPLEGLELTGINLKEGILTLVFNDPFNKTGGGSCRVGLLWAQIRKTVQQFPTVQEVRFLPEELFQP